MRHASPVWWGFASAENKSRTEKLIERLRLGTRLHCQQLASCAVPIPPVTIFALGRITLYSLLKQSKLCVVIYRTSNIETPYLVPFSYSTFIHPFFHSDHFHFHHHSEALPTQHGYCAEISHRSVTGNCELKTCPRSLRVG